MKPAWQQAKRILCVRLDQMGDVLMSTPAMRALKQSIPDARITLLCSSAGAQAARMVPEIDDAIVYAAPWMKAGAPHAREEDLELIAMLARREFDAAVIFTVYSQSPLPAALACCLAGISLRLAHCRENPYQLLTDWIPEREPQEGVRHEVQRQLDLVQHIGATAADTRLSLTPPPADLDWARGQLQALGIAEHGRWLILHPGASAPSRRYPPRHWAEFAREAVRRFECPLLLTGTAEEAPLIEEIRQGVPAAHSLAGMIDLGKLAALISLAPLLVVNNTGPAHIAAAVGTPVVDLYALTNPQHTPWQVPSRVLFHDVPCRNCYKSVCPQGHHHCLELVPPQRVLDAAAELLATT